MTLTELQSKTNEELVALAAELGAIDPETAQNGSAPKRQELVMKLLHAYSEKEGNILANQAVRIAGSVPGFVMMEHNRQNRRQHPRNGLHQHRRWRRRWRRAGN